MNTLQKRVVTTPGVRYFGKAEDGKSRCLYAEYFQNTMKIGIHRELEDQSNGAKFDYKTGVLVYLSGKKCKMLAKIIAKARKSIFDGEEFDERSIGTPQGLIKVYACDDNLAIAIYNDLDENRIAHEGDEFIFGKTNDIIKSYDPRTGDVENDSCDIDTEYFMDQLIEYAKASTDAYSHSIKMSVDYNLNRFAQNQIQIMDKLGIRSDNGNNGSYNRSRTEWSNGGSNNYSSPQKMTSDDIMRELDNIG